MHFILLHSICHFLHPPPKVRLVVLEMLGDPRFTPCPSPSETYLLSFRQKGRLHPLPAQCDAPLVAFLLRLTLSRYIQSSNAVLRFVWYTLSRSTKSKGHKQCHYNLQACRASHIMWREQQHAYKQLIFVQLYSNASMRADQADAT